MDYSLIRLKFNEVYIVLFYCVIIKSNKPISFIVEVSPSEMFTIRKYYSRYFYLELFSHADLTTNGPARPRRYYHFTEDQSKMTVCELLCFVGKYESESPMMQKYRNIPP